MVAATRSKGNSEARMLTRSSRTGANGAELQSLSVARPQRRTRKVNEFTLVQQALRSHLEQVSLFFNTNTETNSRLIVFLGKQPERTPR